jgi:hypothetical protein
VALAYYSDKVEIFCALFAIHHLNAVAWLFAFRENVTLYFSEKQYAPPKHDPHKQFINERRAAMERFLCKTKNIEREFLTAVAYGFSLLLAVAHETRNVAFYTAPFLILSIAEVINQYFSFRERLERDRDLYRIDEKEAARFGAD